jgi:hypothetical protein
MFTEKLSGWARILDILGKLRYIVAMQPQVTSLPSKLGAITFRRSHIRLGICQEWFSQTGSRTFETDQYIRRVYLESLGRLPIAR